MIIPDQDNWYELDDKTGIETIFLIASRKDIKEFDDKIKELRDKGIDAIKDLFPKSSIQEFRFKHE